MRNKIVIFLVLIIAGSFQVQSRQESSNILIKPRNGDNSEKLLRRFELTYSKNIQYFNHANQGKFTTKGGLLKHQLYELPIKKVPYDGATIRSSLGISDLALAKKIEKFNNTMTSKGLKKSSFKKDNVLWVPFEELGISESTFNSSEKDKKATKRNEPAPSGKGLKELNKLFGAKYAIGSILNNSLSKNVFYIISGHGGPDPGAIGYRDGVELHEHEYAYDVSLRLARKLAERGAEVYMIVQDSTDGIRDDRFLGNNGIERLINGDSISPIQLERLKQRTDLVNEISETIGSKKKQLLIEIHVDSRITDKRIDIFFYHQPGSAVGEKACNTLLETIKSKYEINQPGRGYSGTVTARNLFTLRNTSPTGVYIELGNIQNSNDQQRLIDPNNRQAIANWLTDGILKIYNK